MFCFVILHYLVIKDTVECVNSIVSNLDGKYKIVVVDNCSPNNSYNELVQKYKNNRDVVVIKTNKNLGFAKGNNYGYMYAKKNFNASFIACINNDTILDQYDFIERCESLYKEYKYSVLGPDIKSVKDGYHQNPMNKKGVIEYKKLLWGVIKCFLLIIKTYLGIKPSKVDTSYINRNYKEKQFNIKLHGAALIFSTSYINRYDGFYDKTFMYVEEDILYYIAQRDNLCLMYDPSVRILHKEYSASNAITNKSSKRLRFRYRNVIKSNIVFILLKIKDRLRK